MFHTDIPEKFSVSNFPTFPKFKKTGNRKKPNKGSSCGSDTFFFNTLKITVFKVNTRNEVLSQHSNNCFIRRANSGAEILDFTKKLCHNNYQ